MKITIVMISQTVGRDLAEPPIPAVQPDHPHPWHHHPVHGHLGQHFLFTDQQDHIYERGKIEAILKT